MSQRFPVMALPISDCVVSRCRVDQAIVDKIIALAEAGERNPDVLCEQALKEICGESEAA